MALLAVLCALRDGGLLEKDSLFCLHIEHALRPAQESLGDAEFVRVFCQNTEVECHIEHISPGKIASYARRRGTGIEAAARFFRHRALSKAAKRLGKETLILLGHTKNDLLEMALMRILRGVGPAGLAIMPERRGFILRPLLSMTRTDIINYLKAKNIPWREDLTNNDGKYLRNRIRHQLVPLLNEAFPSWGKGIAAMAQTQSLLADFLADEAKKLIRWDENNKPRSTRSFTEDGKVLVSKTPCSSKLSVGQESSVVKISFYLSTEEDNFFAQHQIIREEAIFQGINTLSSLCASVPPCEKKRIKSVRRSVVRKFCEGKVAAVDLGLVRVRREKGKILLSRVKKEYFECGISQLIIR
jgi:tRNA(Ile)-lysidine synthase